MLEFLTIKNYHNMNKQELNEFSKFCSYCLRHGAQDEKLSIDSEGWINVQALLDKSVERGYNVQLEDLMYVVEHNSKKRFQLSSDGQNIRAVQGHTNPLVSRVFESVKPPDMLYHGTATRFLNSIMIEGLSKMSRHHVHLSTNTVTAKEVGQRYGEVVILQINAKKMQDDGFIFYLSENGVWLVDSVPTKYIEQSPVLKKKI